MAKNVNINDFGAILKAATDKFILEVKEAIEINIGDMEIQAIRNAPGAGDLIITQFQDETQESIRGKRNWSPISQSIVSVIEKDGLKGSVFVEKSAGLLAAWVEFGTGQDATSYLATVPPEWKEKAQEYYINGKGTILSQPYILPAYMKYKELFLAELKDAIANFGK